MLCRPSGSARFHVRRVTATSARTFDATGAKVIPPSTSDIEDSLGVSTGRRWKRALWTGLGILLVAGVALAAARWLKPEPKTVQWREVALDRGDIVVEVSATGTLEPARTVRVGAEVSGRVAEVLVDHNDTVTQGQVLVRLDLESFTNTLEEAQASYRGSGTEVTRARATLKLAQFTADQAKQLSERGVISESERLQAETELGVAKASLGTAKSQRSLAKIRVEQAQDQLGKAVITSPIDGVVLRRSVEPGNAIAAALQAPELFVIAEDLRSMELQLDIDEADVGELEIGQPATFSVDAWPDQTFNATVAKVYFAPKTAASVVTYTAELVVANDDLLLRPGMTASADIVTRTRADVLRIPNTALRFTPPADAPEKGSGFRMGPPRMPKKRARVSAVWVLEDGVPTKIGVAGGVTDGYFTEVTAEDGLSEGVRVLIGVDKDAKR